MYFLIGESNIEIHHTLVCCHALFPKRGKAGNYFLIAKLRWMQFIFAGCGKRGRFVRGNTLFHEGYAVRQRIKLIYAFAY